MPGCVVSASAHGGCDRPDSKPVVWTWSPSSKGGAPSRANQLLPAWARRVCPGRVSAPRGWKFCIPRTNAVARYPAASASRNYRKRKPLFSREPSVYVLAGRLPSVVFPRGGPLRPQEVTVKKKPFHAEKSLPAQWQFLKCASNPELFAFFL